MQLLQHGWLWAYASVFLGGFLTSLTPCVYPLIPITVSLFGARGEKRSRALLLAACYVGGIGAMYSGLGLFSALAGRAFGTHMASPWVMVPIALMFLAMAASMFGAFEMALPTSVQTRLSGVGGKGFGGAFLMGLVGGLIAAPCTGPALASVLAFVATTRSVAVGASLLFTYALGMGVLFFLIAGFAVALPKSGAWMDTVKSVFGVVMVVAALYFLRNVIGPLRDYGSRNNLFIGAQALLIGVGAVLMFRSAGLRKALGAAALVLGLFGGIGAALAGSSELQWNQGADVTLARAKALEKPALLDFYADWCLPCKELELKTFSDPKVSRLLSQRELGKVDCTHDDDAVVVATKQEFQAETMPTLVLLRPDGTVAHKIDHFVGPDELAKLLDDGT